MSPKTGSITEGQGGALGSQRIEMKIDLTDSEHEKIIKALEWYYAYTVAQKRRTAATRN